MTHQAQTIPIFMQAAQPLTTFYQSLPATHLKHEGWHGHRHMEIPNYLDYRPRLGASGQHMTRHLSPQLFLLTTALPAPRSRSQDD